MTREEAIGYLKRADVTIGQEVKTKMAEALEMAIKALEQEPITKNNLGVDCISRQEVDRLAYRYLKEPTDNHVAFYEEFLDLPSVTPQELFDDRPCISSGVCEHDKQKVLEKIRAEIEKLQTYVLCKGDTKKIELADVLEILDKYKAESED